MSGAATASFPELSCLHTTFPCLTCHESHEINQFSMWDIAMRDGAADVRTWKVCVCVCVRSGVLQETGRIH